MKTYIINGQRYGIRNNEAFRFVVDLGWVFTPLTAQDVRELAGY